MQWSTLLGTLAATALAATALPVTAPAQAEDRLPDVKLAEFTATEATSLDDYRGRLLLVEYFAYW